MKQRNCEHQVVPSQSNWSLHRGEVELRKRQAFQLAMLCSYRVPQGACKWTTIVNLPCGLGRTRTPNDDSTVPEPLQAIHREIEVLPSVYPAGVPSYLFERSKMYQLFRFFPKIFSWLGELEAAIQGGYFASVPRSSSYATCCPQESDKLFGC